MDNNSCDEIRKIYNCAYAQYLSRRTQSSYLYLDYIIVNITKFIHREMNNIVLGAIITPDTFKVIAYHKQRHVKKHNISDNNESKFPHQSQSAHIKNNAIYNSNITNGVNNSDTIPITQCAKLSLSSQLPIPQWWKCLGYKFERSNAFIINSQRMKKIQILNSPKSTIIIIPHGMGNE